MIFWIDAQLPPILADWLAANYGVQARALRDLGLRDATDTEIFVAAKNPKHVIVSKDSDFVELVTRDGPPPQLLWITCGNVSNQHLQELFGKTFPQALELLRGGEAIVELSQIH
jgi:predicted nuclease of predicted toxin-antitoxin system